MVQTTTRVGFVRIFGVVVLVLLLAAEGQALTASPIIAPTNKYVNVSTYVFNTATYYNSATTTLTHIYANPFAVAQANTNYRVGVSVAKLNYNFPASRQVSYYVDVDSKLTTSCPILWYTDGANKINLLAIYIVIVQPGFMGLFFHYYWNDLGSTFNPGDSYSFSDFGVTSQPAATSSIYSSLIGLDIVTDPTFQVGFNLTVKQINTKDITITLTCISAKKAKVNSFFVLVFLYNNAQLLAVSPPARYTKGSLSAANGNNALLMATDTLNTFRTYNTFIGMKAFWITGGSFLNYDTVTTPSVSISASSTNNWKAFAFDYNVFEFWYCPDTTPYLMVSTNICYDLCPIRYASNTSDFQCDSCPTVDCYYCGSNGKCTQCNATLDFRVMNNATKRCDPLPGYYESGVSAATPCVAANCLTCTSATYCLTCVIGKYLSVSNTCVACMANCLNCTSGSTCVQCATYYVFSVSCVANCSNVTNCLTCSVSSGIVCATCISGYALASNICSSVCGDNILVGTEACDDNNTASGDGCSSTCTIQPKFYCDNSVSPRVCGSCVSNCDICTNPTACVNCSIGYTPAGGLCTLDCLVVSNCSTCEYNLTSNSTVCLTCQTGYSISGNTCVSTCGDGIRVSPQGCDDGNLNATDGCSPTCTVQATFYCTDNYPTNGTSVCANCISFCQVCSDASTCGTCNTGYTYNITCVIDCSPVFKCITCDYNTTTTTTVCSDCAAGYHLDSGNNSCITQCGDGYRNGAEACDDGNLNDTDGCSSTCTLESSFFCNDVNISGGVKSTCTACIPSCTSCINSTACDSCNTGYAYSPTNNSCNIDCSNITLCTVCNFTGTLSCEACQAGYYVISNVCTPRCGDGILLPIQNCDDGNNITGDGCSASCLLEPAFLCTNATNATTTLFYTSCSPCMAHCSDCTGNINDCQLCATDYIYKSTSGVISCEIDCGIFADCSSCTVSQCTTCMPNYAFDSSNTCAPICGDGKVLLGQNCDDGNAANGDGCSSACQVQTNFACQAQNQTSVCSLLTMSINLASINKNPSANQVTVQYLLSPSTLPAFSTLDWSTVVHQQSNLSLTFSSMTYDNATGQLTINANYAQDLNQKLLQLGFNFPLTAPFNLLNTTNTSTILVSDNNLSLQAYDDSAYANSKLLEYIALGTSCLALVLFLLGFYSGKLIGLECITIFQLTFLSLLTFQNLSPSFASLSLLSYSCGYNIKNMQASQVNLGRRFKAVNLSQPFLSNYNITVALIVLPLLISPVMAIINRLRYQSANATLIKYSELLRGQFCFYGLMFSSYSIILSLGIEVGHIGVGMVGLAIGGLLVLVLLTYCVLLHKKPEIFGEFSEKFNKESVIQSHFYCFIVAERVLTTAGLLMMSFNPQGAIILVMLAIQIVIVLWKQPYKGQRAWLRPFLNLLIAALIQLIFLMNPMLSKSIPVYSLYGPFAVVGLLAVSLAYNIYYFVQNLRTPSAETPEAKQAKQAKQEEEEQKKFIMDEYNKLDAFLKKVMESPKLSMLEKSSNGLELEQPGSPSKLHGEVLNEVRGKLNKVKLNAGDLSNISMSQDISFGEGMQL